MLHKSFIVYCRMSTAVKGKQVSSYWLSSFVTLLYYTWDGWWIILFIHLLILVMFSQIQEMEVILQMRPIKGIQQMATINNQVNQIHSSTRLLRASKIKNSVMYFNCLLKRWLLFYYHNIVLLLEMGKCLYQLFHQLILSLQVFKPCHLVISCLRSPIFLGGRYLKVCMVIFHLTWIVIHSR